MSDWYFKNLFKELRIIKNLIVSHLGEPDINWFGKDAKHICMMIKYQIIVNIKYNNFI